MFSLGVLLFSLLKEIQGGPTVETSNGIVEGSAAYTVSENVFYHYFWGIPYAKPPVDDLRFEPPQPVSNWSGILNATTERNQCFQETSVDHFFGYEDCLYLDVYTTELPKNYSNNPLRAVMVWVHGGNFIFGTKDYTMFGPDYLLEHDIVFVAMNYRLGVFGFLSTEDLVVPGNNAIKDVIQALKWVQKNIVNFGGNPNEVTLFGHSAGATITSYILQSNLGAGLFRQAIMQSAVSINPWAMSPNPRKLAFRVGLALGINVSNSSDLISKLKAIDALELAKTSISAASKNVIDNLNGLDWSPVMEPLHSGAVQSEASINLISSGRFNRVPIIVGYVTSEGTTISDTIIRLGIASSNSSVETKSLIPVDINITSNMYYTVNQNIRKYYFGSLPLVTHSQQFLKYISEAFFSRSILKATQFYSKYTKTRLYRFAFGNDAPYYYDPAVPHGGELAYLSHSKNFTFSSNILGNVTRKRMATMWTNFAKYGNPTPEVNELINVQWPEITNRSEIECLEIEGQLSILVNPEKEALEFWESQEDIAWKEGNLKCAAGILSSGCLTLIITVFLFLCGTVIVY